MKKSFSYLILIVLIVSSLNFAEAMYINPCGDDNKTKLTSEADAISCLQWRLENQTAALYAFATDSGHTCDTTKCGTYTSDNGGSCFTTDSKNFQDNLSSTTIYKCSANSQKWSCWGESTNANGCFIAPGGVIKGVMSNQVFFSIGDGSISNKILTFFPASGL